MIEETRARAVNGRIGALVCDVNPLGYSGAGSLGSSSAVTSTVPQGIPSNAVTFDGLAGYPLVYSWPVVSQVISRDTQDSLKSTGQSSHLRR